MRTGTQAMGVPGGPPAAPPVAPPPRRTARFIATETAQSSLKLAEDGKLPELRLQEPGQADVKEVGPRGVNPLLLFGGLAFSVAISIILVLMPTESTTPSRSIEKQNARLRIEEEYFADMDKGAALAPYQIMLREALQAHWRRDFAQEQRLYRKVLDLLRAERGKFDRGLTGSPKRDEDLEKLITILLTE